MAKKKSRKAKAKLAKPVQKTRGKKLKWSKLFLKILFIAVLIYGAFYSITADLYDGISIIVGAVVVALIIFIISRLMKK